MLENPAPLRTRCATALVLTLSLLVLSASLRVFDVDAMVNVDMYHLWGKRIVRFVAAIDSRSLAETYQSHHPGVTFMWLAGMLWKVRGVLSDPLEPTKLQLATWPVVAIGTLFPVATFLLLWRALGQHHRNIAWVAGALLATEPLLIAHSRNAHLDMLVTAFAWAALLAAYIAKLDWSWRWSLASGLLLGLALLTKLSSAGLALGIAYVLLSPLEVRSGDRLRSLKHLAIVGVTAGVTAAILWPALWVAPIETLTKLWRGVNVEMDKTSEFMLFGQTGRLRLPRWIYGLFVVYLVTPEFWLSGLFVPWLTKGGDQPLRRFAGDMALAALPLIALLVASSRIGNRYLIPILPMFAILSAIALVAAWQKLSGRLRWHRLVPLGAAVAAALVGGRTVRAAALHPLPITYCSSWTGVDCSKVFHLGWGEGLKEGANCLARLASQRPHEAPPKVYGSAYATLMRLWTPLASTKDFDEAEYLVIYLPDAQRRLEPARRIEAFAQARGLNPLASIEIQGRPYVRIYPGPSY